MTLKYTGQLCFTVPLMAPTTMRSIMNVIKRLKTKAWVSGERAAGSNQIKAVAGIQTI